MRTEAARRPKLTLFAVTAVVITTGVLAQSTQRGGAAPRSTAAAASSALFANPTVVDPVHAYGEPDIKFAPDGTIYDSGPWGTGTQRSIWNQSTDGGRTFHTLHAPAIGSASESDSTIPCPAATPPPCPGGGDTEISIDASGKVYYADLAALVTLKTARWDRATKTMNTGLITNPPPHTADGFDRQWFANWHPASRPAGYTGPLPVNYLVYAEALAGCCEAASYSTDGVTYVPPTAEYSISNDGPLEIDQQTGTVLEAVSINSLNDVGVAILRRDPAHPSNPALTKVKLVKIATLPSGTNTRALFPVIGFDRGRNAYVAWVTRSESTSSANPNAWQIWFSYSTATSGWQTWSRPVKLSHSPSNTNVMPWAVAGGTGRLAVVWYGTSDSTHNPSTDDVHQSWDVYLAMVENANSAAPTIDQTRVTRHPMHYGTICLEGLGCITVRGNRNLADFFQVTTDPRDGAVVVTYDDTSNELLQEFLGVGDGTADHRGAPVVMQARQTGGTGLFGTTVGGIAPTGPILGDRSGDARFDPIYGTTSIPALDLVEASIRRSGSNLVFVLDTVEGGLTDSNLTGAFAATGAGAIDYVVRWTGAVVNDPQTGVRNPIYYAAMEALPDGSKSFFAGQARAVELCSVSGCFPHIVDYPRPPRAGSTVGGTIPPEPGGPDDIRIVVPRSLVGNQSAGSLLESFSAYSFARNKSAALGYTNAEGEGGITPIEIDGVCCRDVVLP